MIMSNKIYDILKYVCTIALPGIAALWITLASIWGFPYMEEVAGTITAINTFLGVLLGISNNKYKKEVDNDDC